MKVVCYLRSHTLWLLHNCLSSRVNFPELYCSNSSDQCSTSFLNGCEGTGFVLEVDEHTIAVLMLFLLAAFNIFKHPSTVGFMISFSFGDCHLAGRLPITAKICGDE